MPGRSLWSCIGPKTPPGSMVTIRIRSWRPAMPSISGPSSTVASTSVVTPLVSGAAGSSLIVLSSLSSRAQRSTFNPGRAVSDTRAYLRRRRMTLSAIACRRSNCPPSTMGRRRSATCGTSSRRAAALWHALSRLVRRPGGAASPGDANPTITMLWQGRTRPCMPWILPLIFSNCVLSRSSTRNAASAGSTATAAADVRRCARPSCRSCSIGMRCCTSRMRRPTDAPPPSGRDL